ncbi:hypothetical protein DL93DRAFT_2100570 [Clavulina sp. PMI_390]|nr:hypothetical protein DL93DRAFT_2100570 [Clavulina sp. PMI_390]
MFSDNQVHHRDNLLNPVYLNLVIKSPLLKFGWENVQPIVIRNVWVIALNNLFGRTRDNDVLGTFRMGRIGSNESTLLSRARFAHKHGTRRTNPSQGLALLRLRNIKEFGRAFNSNAVEAKEDQLARMLNTGGDPVLDVWRNNPTFTGSRNPLEIIAVP